MEESAKGDRSAIVVTEIPYQVNKAMLIENIANLVQNKKIEGIADVRDESDREGMRIVIEVKRGEFAVIAGPSGAGKSTVVNLLLRFFQLEGGSILIEFIFVYQGIWQLLLNSINSRDYPVMQAVFLIASIAVIVANLIADIMYYYLDPRVQA